MSLLAPLLSFILLYKYPALFAVMFITALILPVPTNTLLLAAGAFAGQGYFGFFLSVLAAITGNILGDCTGYFLARRYGRRTLQILHVRVPPYIERLETYGRKHPGPTIFLTRFVGAADSVVNLLSGYIGVGFGTFLFYDFLGNLVSIGGVIYIGDFFGNNWQDFTGIFGTIGWITLGLVVAAALALALWYRQRRKRTGKDESLED